MGLFDRLIGREKFSSQVSIADPAFAAWLSGTDNVQEAVNAYTVLGLAAVRRAVEIICVIAGLPLKTYERQGDERSRVPSEFDDPYPGIDGMTPFAWVETLLTHLLIWRNAYLWHEARADGTPGIAYRPIHPDLIVKVKRVNGRKVFEYRESGSSEIQEAGPGQITHIPGPSVDGLSGLPLLSLARAAFSAAISADKTTMRTMRRGIRLAGLVVPAENEEVDEKEGEAILEKLRSTVLGSDNAGDIALINRRLELTKWQATNTESQWHEILMYVLTEIEQIFGVPPHLMADMEKQTSWGTGVQEQNLGLARFTLRGWSDRIEQVLARRLPPDQFCEFDYKGLLQGTPAQEIELLLKQVREGVITIDEYRRIQNLPPMTPAQKAESALARQKPASVTDKPLEIAA